MKNKSKEEEWVVYSGVGSGVYFVDLCSSEDFEGTHLCPTVIENLRMVHNFNAKQTKHTKIQK